MTRAWDVFERCAPGKPLKSCLLLRHAAFNKTPLFGCQMRIEKPSVSGEVLLVSVLLGGLSEKGHRSPSC
jgi:hypothetical protein